MPNFGNILLGGVVLHDNTKYTIWDIETASEAGAFLEYDGALALAGALALVVLRILLFFRQSWSFD